MLKTPLFLRASGIVCLSASLVVGIAGCGGSSHSSALSGSSSSSYFGTQAPGDVWDWTLGSSTFSADNETQGLTFSGTSTLLQSGFYKLGVTASSNSALVGQSAYAFQIPGVAIVAQPVGTNTAPVVGAALGTTMPSGSLNYNWVNIPSSSWTPTSDAFGTVALNNVNGSISASITSYQLNGTLLGNSSDTFTITNGQVTDSGGTTNGVFTPDGVVILDLGPGHGGVVGMQQPSANVDLADLTNNRQFRGMLFKGGHGSELVWAQSNGAGGLTAGGYTDVDNNVEDSDPTHNVTLAFTGQPSSGEIQGTITVAGVTTPIALTVSKAGGKYVLFGFTDDSGTPYNFLVIEK